MTATQTDWITFDNIYNSANGSAAFEVFDPLFFLQIDDKGTWRATPGLIERQILRTRNGLAYLAGANRPDMAQTPRDLVWKRDKARLWRYRSDTRRYARR